MPKHGDDLPKTSLEYILWAMIPYTEPNLKLAFKPSLFFNDLEKISSRNKQALRNTYYKAARDGLLVIDERNNPRLTEKGYSKIKPYKPKKLKREAVLLVVFDIPESERHKRRHLRNLLRELSFRQVQKSVWASKFDHRKYLSMEIRQHGLKDYVTVFEAASINV